MKGSIKAIAAIALIASVPLTYAKEAEPVELSATEIAALQTKTYDAPYSVLFPAVMSTLQGSDYVNINADRDAGTATAETDAKSKLVYNIFWGFGKKKRTQVASIFMEGLGANQSTLRLKLNMVETKNRGMLGGSYSDGKQVLFGEPYRDFYAKLDAEVARRLAMATAATEQTATPPASSTVAPAAPPAASDSPAG